ncbi:hypothetical protein F4777DRAFT_583995 [Nemania sp. FL0916]|nr:hypothetical protein F4777DRAFT_583995 [Nemania sp. FL0916]
MDVADDGVLTLGVQVSAAQALRSKLLVKVFGLGFCECALFAGNTFVAQLTNRTAWKAADFHCAAGLVNASPETLFCGLETLFCGLQLVGVTGRNLVAAGGSHRLEPCCGWWESLEQSL